MNTIGMRTEQCIIIGSIGSSRHIFIQHRRHLSIENARYIFNNMKNIGDEVDIIDNAYRSLLNYRNLVNYYTRKNISVSYLRAKQTNDTDRVLALYGSADERYW